MKAMNEHLLDEIYREFRDRCGACVIAGGAVRDTLMERTPKDYDVFSLLPVRSDRFSDLEQITLDEHHKSEPFLQGTFRYKGLVVQVMQPEVATVTDLLDTFDWNVSRFAYDGQFHCLMDHAGIKPGGELKLHKITYPLSTLRRAYRFSERFGMEIDTADLLLTVDAAKRALAKKLKAEMEGVRIQ